MLFGLYIQEYNNILCLFTLIEQGGKLASPDSFICEILTTDYAHLRERIRGWNKLRPLT